MTTFLEAALRILTEAGEPLSPSQIVERAVAQGLLHTRGETPHQTMKSKLSTEILRRKDASPFMRTERGRFGLRAWGGVDEYVADRFQKALLDEEIVVFDTAIRKDYLPEPGLSRTPLADGEGLIAETRAMSRREAEEDPSVIQLVSAFVMRHGDRYLTYKRTRRLPESRLHDYFSLIFGGHLTPDDIPGLWNIFDPVNGHVFLQRELSEEIRLPRESKLDFRYRGVIYDESRDLSKQHLGIAFDVFLNEPTFTIGERGFLMQPRWETAEEINRRRGDFENWSLLLLDDDTGKASLPS